MFPVVDNASVIGKSTSSDDDKRVMRSLLGGRPSMIRDESWDR